MLNTTFIFSRRYFLKSSIAMTGIVAMPFGYTGNQTLPSSSVSEAKYTRYNVMSEGGKKALRSYAKGIEAMLNLSAVRSLIAVGWVDGRKPSIAFLYQH